jgi:hypothetical protein
METREEEEVFCQPINAEKVIDSSSETSTNYSSFESSIVGTECCICYEIIGKTNNCVTECGHAFCLKCLVTAMAHNPDNTGCPCCRSNIIEPPASEEDDEDDDSDWEEGDSDDEDENDQNIIVEKGNVEEVVARLEKEGFTMLDVVSLLINKFSKTDDKYTMQHIEKMCDTVDKIVDDVGNESAELEQMEGEDIKV